jgi:hypothetical protein
MATKTRDPEVEYPEPECKHCAAVWCDDSQLDQYTQDRRAWLDHIFALPTRDAVGAHVRQRCRWIYGTGQPERLEADVRAFIASWVSRRDLDEQERIKEARAKEVAEQTGRQPAEAGTMFDDPQTAHEKFPWAFVGAQEPYGWERVWTYCRCDWCTAKRERSA